MVIVTLLAFYFAACSKRETISLESVSPNGKFEVKLVERPGLDRNFKVILKRGGGAANEVYASPDEGRPIGTERIIWSKDNDYFLLVGKHFVMKGDTVKNGEQLYLLYQISTKKLWSNATQANHARFSRADLQGIQFEEVLPDTGTAP